MATLIPSLSTCTKRMTGGERGFAQRLIDKLKLLYVAMTRAMEMLLMTCSRETEFVKRIKEARSRAAG
ncbi:MAG: hypothetical protein A3I01_08130 [Betaproteobacteria bacterium RIFCSPLOWO2_02_FULL_65_24]|nr:MAG: hypothetical protein A3I01_08130 [Betaproteobacteria bacterium RIFCSPLOWO2_02_FULL_65_24]